MNEQPTTPQTQTPKPVAPPPAPGPSPEREAEQAALDSSAAKSAPGGQPKMSGKKKALIIALVLLLIGGGAAVWYFVLRPKPAEAPAAQTEPAQQAVLQPSRVVYTQATNGTDRQIGTVPLAGGTPALAANVNNVTHSDVVQDKVVVATEVTADGQTTLAIRYSSDGGQTFAQVFSETKAEGESAQITSLKLASDGSKAAFGYLPAPDGENTVKSVDLSSKQVADLFTTEEAGAFIRGYDADQQTVYFFGGCYNCDANTNHKLLSRKTGDSADTVLYDRTDTFGVEVDFNDDFSKAVVVSGVPGDLIGPEAPYTVAEFTVSSKEFKTIATVASNAEPVQAGFAEDQQSIYYSEGNSVFSVAPDGSKVTAFEASEPIFEVGYVGTDYVVASMGNSQKHTIVTFDIKQDKAASVVAASAETGLVGVSWQ